MLTKKYLKEFTEIYDTEGTFGQMLRNVISTEEEEKKDLLNWEDKEIAVYLKRANAISPKTLVRHMVILRKFANFICKKEKIAKREYLMEDGVYMQIGRAHV